MSQKSGSVKEPAEKVVRDIRRATRRRYSAVVGVVTTAVCSAKAESCCCCWLWVCGRRGSVVVHIHSSCAAGDIVDGRAIADGLIRARHCVEADPGTMPALASATVS
jgi:hypothetical protein